MQSYHHTITFCHTLPFTLSFMCEACPSSTSFRKSKEPASYP